MTAQWYLLRNKAKGKGIGPMPAIKLLELASAGGTRRGDWVRLEGSDVEIPVERFLALVRADNSLPEWVNDVAQSELLLRSDPDAAPDWLDDITADDRTPSAGLPVDWLDDVQQIEASLRAPMQRSVGEVFLEAQRALQKWVAAEANRPLVVRGGLEGVRRCPAVQKIFRRYERYGPVMKEKLLKRLALLVDIQQKVYRASRAK